MKRRHYLELEDQPWFPGWIRVLMTRYLVAFHRALGSPDAIAELAARALRVSGQSRIHDFCSGHGGPQRDVLRALRERHGLDDVRITLSDLHPDPGVAASFNDDGDGGIEYLTHPVDASRVNGVPPGLRTMICGLHHMPPDVARAILADAAAARQPFLAYELSDNGAPRWLWWTAFPLGALLVMFVTPRVRPMTWRQLVFTYLVPLLPLSIGWDGAVSNARTYGVDDIAILLDGVASDGYRWETGTVPAGPARSLYLLGLPVAP